MIRLTGAQVTMLEEALTRFQEKFGDEVNYASHPGYGGRHRAWEEFIDETKYDLVRILFPTLAGSTKPKVEGVPCVRPIF